MQLIIITTEDLPFEHSVHFGKGLISQVSPSPPLLGALRLWNKNKQERQIRIRITTTTTTTKIIILITKNLEGDWEQTE